MESRRPGGKRRRFNIFFLVLVVIFLYFSGILVNQQIHLHQVDAAQEEAGQRLARAQQEHDALIEEKNSLEDPAYIEKIAREELGMTRHGEIPYAASESRK
jgi:cell division protein FtsL